MWKPWTLVLTKSISSKTVYCCFSYGGSLDFPEFLQNSFITSTVGSTYKAKTFQIGASKLESPTATKSRERERMKTFLAENFSIFCTFSFVLFTYLDDDDPFNLLQPLEKAHFEIAATAACSTGLDQVTYIWWAVDMAQLVERLLPIP